MSRGPLAVRWGESPDVRAEAGAVTAVRLDVENAGTVAWRPAVNVNLSYHWLDLRDNPIHWDGIRTPAPALAPGERATVELPVRGLMPPGRYRLAFDAVAEHRAWFSELGSSPLAVEVEVAERSGEGRVDLPPGLEPTDAWREHVAAAHRDGYAVVAGSIEWQGGPLRRRPRALAPYEPGSGRIPAFAAPLVCPSVLPGVELERVADVAGFPAYAAPRDEPWIYDGRAVLRARPRSGRRPT